MKQKILHILLSVIIAFGIWVYVVTVVSPESESTYYNIPVVLTNEATLLDKGLMITSDTDPSVTLQLRGNRTDLNSLKNSDITVVADLSKIHGAGEQQLSCDVSFTGSSGNAFEILNQEPSRITLQIAEWSTKEVPVVVNYTGMLGLDYIAYKDELELDREYVNLTGPKSVVDQVTQARIDVNLDGQTESIFQNYRYTLCNDNNEPVDVSAVTTNTAEVAVTLKIQRVKEIQLQLDVIYGGGATAENTIIQLSQQAIKVSGSDKLLDGLDTLVLGSVNLAEIPEETVMSFPIILQEGIENLSGITEVTADISFPELTTRTLNVDKILIAGLPAGMSYDIGTKVVAVTVRGPNELVEEISADNISVLINLSSAELGEDLYKAQILIDSEFDPQGRVGVIGSYSVLVTLKQTTEDMPDGTEG